MKCSRCGKGNTEFSSFSVDVDLSSIREKIHIKSNSWIKKVLIRYLNILLRTDIDVEVHICQSCMSKMFRKLDKNK